MSNQGRRLATDLVRGGLERSGWEETSEALVLTSGFVYASAEEAEAAFAGDVDRYIYSRYGNPTVAMFEERLRVVEGAEAVFATSSGMAAVFTSLISLLSTGDRVVAARGLFGSCFLILDELLPRWGIETTFVDGDDLDAWARALDEGSNRGLPFDNDEWLVDLGEIGKANVDEFRVRAHVNEHRIRISGQLGEGLFWRYISCVGHWSAPARTTAWAVTI